VLRELTVDSATNHWDEIRKQLGETTPANRLAVQNRVARQIQTLLKEDQLPKPVSSLRIAMLRSITAELMLPPIVSRLAEYDLAANVTLGQLGNIAHETLAPDSFVYSGSFDLAVVFALSEHVLTDVTSPTGPGAAGAGEQFLAQIGALAERFSGQVIVANLTEPLDTIAPLLATHNAGSAAYQIASFNTHLAELTAQHANLAIWDVDRIARTLGSETLCSRRDMATSMQPFTPGGLDALAVALADVVMLSRRTPVKCIVLDCDNTLWGGIIGEDGLGGIKLGETYPGLCFQQFQRQLVQLSQLGFLLAINSKNNEADVWKVFDEHAGMLLKRDMITAHRINWQDKVTNLRDLAGELNIGLDSFVFIDDSDFEINLVRSELPMVRAIQVPKQAWELTRLLPESRIVDRLRVTKEDQAKTQMYKAEAERRALKQTSTDIGTYLKSLEIEMVYEPFREEVHLTRAAQLTQKTNQFNLTTKRYDEAAVVQFAQGDGLVALAHLKDRFGDYGRVVLAIVTRSEDPTVAQLDTFLMSCRVIGRGVEHSFLRLVMKSLVEKGVKRLEACYRPTEKNGVCAEFLPTAGFSEVSRDEEQGTRYVYDLEQEIPEPEAWLTITELTANHA
jgi:FkbH-like protein